MSPHHLLLAIQRPSSNILTLVRVYSIHCLGERGEGNLVRVPVMDGDGQEVEVVYSGFLVDADTDIALRGRHVRRQVERDRECPALPQKLHNALHVHRTDETSIAADNPLRSQYNAPDAEQLFCLDKHMCHLMGKQSISQILCNQLNLFGVADNDGIPTDIASI